MEKISEFFKELRDRFSNPLFFSFIVGWLAINWKIVIGLFFYSMQQLEKDGYYSYFDLITKNSTITSTFCYPFTIALGYTFLVPIIRNWISMFNAWNQRWGSKKTLKISEEGQISVSKYIKLREIYEKRRQLIEEVLAKESGYVEENANLNSEKIILQNKLNDTEQEVKKIKSNNNLNQIMQGSWLIKIGPSTEEKRVIIQQNEIYANDQYEKKEKLYKITDLAFNALTNEMIIVFHDFSKPNDPTLVEVFRTETIDIKFLKNNSNRGAIMSMRKEDS